MANAQLSLVLRHIRKLAGAENATDRQLLHRFATQHEEAAFELLVERHGPAVLGLCHRVLRHEHDAEDVFQATFLTLARKASSIRKPESLGCWLYGVASRLALKVRASGARRHTAETVWKPGESSAGQGLCAALDEELNRLAWRYQAPIVLCYLQGKTRDEAARQLRWSLGTLKLRLSQGREILRDRLTRRGLTLSAVLVAVGLSQETVPAALLVSTARAARYFAAGATAGVSAKLAEGALKGILLSKLKIVAALLLAASLVGVGAGLIAHQVQTEKQPEKAQPASAGAKPEKPVAQEKALTDRYGDPLPRSAIARIGTIRWWHGRDVLGCPLVYAPDGKSLVSCDSGKAIQILDAATGKELRRIETPGDPISCLALSPDGKTIVTGSITSPVLRSWDISTGKELRRIPTGDKDTSVIAFAPDGKMLAAVTGQTVIRVWDVATWQEIRQLAGHTRWIGSVVFLPDGKTLVSGGGITHTMRWWDVSTGREIRRLDKAFEHRWDLAVSPDGTRLAAIGSPNVLYLWNATTGEEVSRTVVRPESGSSCMCFSPDSQTLVCGDSVGRRGNQTSFFSAVTGQELRRWDEDSYTIRLAFSPDGKVLAQAAAGVIRLRDAATGKPILEMPGLPNYVMSVRFAPDGKTLFTNCWGGQCGCWDPLTGEQCTALHGPPEGFAGRADMLLATALSADGRKAALVDTRGVLHIWDPATGKVWCRINDPSVGNDQADFSPDGNILVVKHVDNVIRLWDTVTGKLRCSLPRFGERRFPHPHAFSPDGRVLATAPSSMDKSVIRLWETPTGKELGQLAWLDSSSPSCLAFSTDGKYLVAAHGRHGTDALKEDDIGLRLWDLATGRELRRFKAPTGDIRAVVISPDGKTLAAGAYDTVLLWELASGRERGRFTGHREWVWSLAFSANGRLLASGSLDYTALVWDLTGLSGDGKLFSRATRPDEIERLGTELSSGDGLRAYRAMWMMVAAARPSVSFLAERLRPEKPVEDDRLERWIAELDSDQFKVRTRASQELEELGELAETAMREALAGTLSLEARQRLENLLHKVEDRILSPKQLLTLRALEVLEQIASPEAKQVLQTLATGAPEARLTQEAKASLDRLAKRP